MWFGKIYRWQILLSDNTNIQYQNVSNLMVLLAIIAVIRGVSSSTFAPWYFNKKGCRSKSLERGLVRWSIIVHCFTKFLNSGESFSPFLKGPLPFLAMLYIACLVGSLKYGGSPSTNSIARIPKLHTSTYHQMKLLI